MPLLIKSPRQFRKTVVDEVVSLIDVVPTTTNALGQADPEAWVKRASGPPAASARPYPQVLERLRAAGYLQ